MCNFILRIKYGLNCSPNFGPNLIPNPTVHLSNPTVHLSNPTVQASCEFILRINYGPNCWPKLPMICCFAAPAFAHDLLLRSTGICPSFAYHLLLRSTGIDAAKAALIAHHLHWDLLQIPLFRPRVHVLR